MRCPRWPTARKPFSWSWSRRAPPGLHYALPITGAIIILLVALVVSYRQVIEAFPGGGGAYAVAKAHLGARASLVAAASLIVDYVLNAAVGVSAGIAALTSAFPVLYGGRR
jgi:amino acid transporter